MKKILKYKILGLALILSAMVGCDQAEQEVSPVVEPNESYPMVTYTPITNTTIAENDTVVLFTITTDRPLDRALTFRASQTGGTADASDYTIINATVQPYTTEAQLIMITTEGWQGEATETAEFIVRMTSLADKYLINPDATQSATISLSITNNNYPVPIHCDLEDGETTKDGKVSLYFDGDVSPVSGKKITLEDRGGYASIWPNLVIDAADLVLEDGEFIVEHPDFIEWTAIRMTVDSGAFVDDLGNVNLKTVIDFDIPFVIASYAGEYQLISDDGYGPYTDTLEIEVFDAENNILAVPDGDDLVDYLELEFDLANYKVTMKDVKTDYYLVYDVWYSPPRYYLATSAAYNDPDVLEASQISYRNYGQGTGYFNEIDFEYGFMYTLYGDLVKGDGTYGTNGTIGSWSMDYTPITGEAKTMVKNQVSEKSKIEILDEFIDRNGNKAININFMK